MKIAQDLIILLSVAYMIEDAAVPKMLGRQFPKPRKKNFVFHHCLDAPYGQSLWLFIHITILIVMAAIIKRRQIRDQANAISAVSILRWNSNSHGYAQRAFPE